VAKRAEAVFLSVSEGNFVEVVLPVHQSNEERARAASPEYLGDVASSSFQLEKFPRARFVTVLLCNAL
jgi:hypothetical protein